MIGGSEDTSNEENILFWIFWALTIFICTIIFLNFVISEASASYEKVNEHLEEFITKDQCKLISEAELMIPYITRNQKDFPKYLSLIHI